MKYGKLIKVSPDLPDAMAIAEATSILGLGGVVAFPTETVYGLGADAYSVDAVRKVFEAKGRPADNPLIVHIAEFDQVGELVKTIPPKATLLIQKFWPGPLTLVLERSSRIPDIVTAGLETLAIRMPKHAVALTLIKTFGRGIVGPSANLSGSPSPTKAEHVQTDLGDRIDMILDAGPTQIGVESTIVDVTVDPPMILRFGGLEQERIEEVIGEVRTTSDNRFLKRSPGTQHRHYAPRAKVVLFEEGNVHRFTNLLQEYQFDGRKLGCIIHSQQLMRFKSYLDCFVVMGSIQSFSQNLYDTFRQFDQRGVDLILVESVSEKGLGAALMDRIKRAAANGSLSTKEVVH